MVSFRHDLRQEEVYDNAEPRLFLYYAECMKYLRKLRRYFRRNYRLYDKHWQLYTLLSRFKMPEDSRQAGVHSELKISLATDRLVEWLDARFLDETIAPRIVVPLRSDVQAIVRDLFEVRSN